MEERARCSLTGLLVFLMPGCRTANKAPAVTPATIPTARLVICVGRVLQLLGERFRSFAEGTSMKTISSHIGSELRALPPHARAEALRDMLRKHFGERPGVAGFRTVAKIRKLNRVANRVSNHALARRS